MAKVLVGKIRFGGEEMWLPERSFCDNLLTFTLNAAGVDRLLTVWYSEGVVLSPQFSYVLLLLFSYLYSVIAHSLFFPKNVGAWVFKKCQNCISPEFHN